MSEQLSLYRVDMKYNRNLARHDENVLSVSPQIGKENRPFVGILIMLNGKKYCAPITSAKPKHSTMPKNFDYLRITERQKGKDKLIAVINFNNMIPVHESVIQKVNLTPSKNDTPQTRQYKKLMGSELNWCRTHSDLIRKNAQKTYDAVVYKNPYFAKLLKRCCDFPKLERELEKWLEQQNVTN